MKDRIKMIMDAENMTPARFADSLQIGRAVISHILNGRNNPSLDVISRILSQMPQVSSEWLLTGRGSMYIDKNIGDTNVPPPKEASASSSSVSKNYHPDLFAENYIKPTQTTEQTEYRKEIGVNTSVNPIQDIVNERIIYKERPERKISKIIIYYSDNTFETFNADNKPL